MVPYEAFLSEKPVLTTTDAGGPLEVVTTAAPAASSRPDAAELAGARRMAARASRRGARLRAGRAALAARVTWDTCIEPLLS